MINLTLMTATQKKSSRSPLPVSRKFYDALLIRIDRILHDLFHDPAPGYFQQARLLVDNYLNDKPDSHSGQEITPEVRVIFITLKAEIDRARQRSIKARMAARQRALRAKSGLKTVETIHNTPDGTCTHPTPLPSSTTVTHQKASIDAPRKKHTDKTKHTRRYGLKWNPDRRKPAASPHRYKTASNGLRPTKPSHKPYQQ